MDADFGRSMEEIREGQEWYRAAAIYIDPSSIVINARAQPTHHDCRVATNFVT